MKNIHSTVLLETMTRNELRSVAKASNTPRGRNRTDTIANLTKAVELGNLQVQFLATVKTPPVAPAKYGKVVFMKKLRTYKPDKVVLSITS